MSAFLGQPKALFLQVLKMRLLDICSEPKPVLNAQIFSQLGSLELLMVNRADQVQQIKDRELAERGRTLIGCT